MPPKRMSLVFVGRKNLHSSLTHDTSDVTNVFITTEQPSQERILQAAVKLFLEQSVRKTSAEEVAFQAGVTRVTVYRYLTDKKGLVRAVCSRLASIFERAAEVSRGRSIDEIDACLNQLGTELSAFAPGNQFALFDEIHRLYPEVFEGFRVARETAIDIVFQQARPRPNATVRCVKA